MTALQAQVTRQRAARGHCVPLRAIAELQAREDRERGTSQRSLVLESLRPNVAATGLQAA